MSQVSSLALVGFGAHAQFLIASLIESTCTKLCAICTSHPERASFVRKKVPELSIVQNFEEILRSTEVECVLIALPNHLHFDWSQRALLARKHVLCEKPLTLSSAEARTLRATAGERHRLLVEAFYYRLHPQFVEIRRLLDSGAIGKLQEIQVAYHFALNDPANYRLIPEAGGGALYDVGCYGIDCARFLLNDEVEQVRLKSIIRNADTKVDQSCEFELCFKGGVRAHVSCSMIHPKRENSLTLVGSDGTLSAPHAFHLMPGQKTALILSRKGEKSETLPQQAANQYTLFLDHFGSCSSNLSQSCQKSPFPSSIPNASVLEDGAENMAVLEKIRALF